MPDRPGTNGRATVDRPSTDRAPTGGDTVTIAEAAARLGLSTDAVRSRLHRGTLDGTRSADGWAVFLPRSAPTVDQPSPTVDRPGTDRVPTVGAVDLIAALRDRIVSQEGEITYLRDQLDHSRRELAAERERFDVLHREALARIPALGAGENAAPGASHDTKSEPTTGQSEAISANPGTEASTEIAPQKAVRRAWWRFWER